MQDIWYYSLAGQALGPVTIEQLRAILSSNSNFEGALVWRQGMANWARVAEIDDLKSLLRSGPPPIPGPMRDLPVETLEGATHTKSHPWRRFFARNLDVYVFSIPFLIVVGLVFPSLFVSQNGADTQGTDYLMTILALAAYAVFESFCLWAFGGSFGKLVYGITLAPETGGQFTIGVAIKRSLAVWVRGMGIGIPIVTLFTLITAYNTLKKEGRASWDRDFNCLVRHKDLSVARWLVIGLVWTALAATYVFLIAIGSR